MQAAAGDSFRGRRDRLLRHSAEWFTEGAQKKAEARRRRECVECRHAMNSGRSPYCGRKCQWRFRGRYFWDAARTFVIHRDRFTCQQCHRRNYVRDLEVDHVIEIAAGGAPLDYANLQTICRTCHRAKTVMFLRGKRKGGPSNGAEISTGASDWVLDWFPS